MTDETKKTKPRKTQQPLTLAEFRAWLSGVEDLHPKNWHPDAAQWKLIRDKMMCIVEEQTLPPTEHTLYYPPGVRSGPQPPMGTGLPPGITPPPPVGGIPFGEVAMSPEAKRLLNTGGTSKTPDVDTSSGSYNSSFL